MTKSVNKESIHLIFWDHVRRFWICWAMNASCKAHKPSCKSNYEQDLKKSSTMIFCNLRALEKIRRTRDLRKSDAIRKYWILRIQSWFVTNCTKTSSGKISTVNNCKLTLNTSQKLRADEMCDGVRRQVFVRQAGEGLINKKAKQWSK